MNKGIIYVVVGDIKYLKECIFSATSLKKHCPDIPITLFTDNLKVKASCFDEVKTIVNDINAMKIKVKYLYESPYEYTLFLDSDTQVRKPIYEMFDLLVDCDIALANRPKIDRSYMPAKLISYTEPDAYNTGVILYKKSEPNKNFFSKWLEVVMLQDNADMWAGHYCDQYYFDKLIQEKHHLKYGVKLKIFSNKLYNVRPPMILQLKKDGEMDNVKILHCHNLHKTFLVRQCQRLWQRISKDWRKK